MADLLIDQQRAVNIGAFCSFHLKTQQVGDFFKPYSCILHDWNVQVVQDADDDAFPGRGAHGVVERFNINQNLEPILNTIFCKRFHQPSN